MQARNLQKSDGILSFLRPLWVLATVLLRVFFLFEPLGDGQEICGVPAATASLQA